MLKWADRNCGNCAFFLDPFDDQTGWCTKTAETVVADESGNKPAYLASTARCGDHHTETEVNININRRGSKG